jgi:glyoxylase-like metal-dependent hydrolase (beta-lactamase superfamily II)
LPSSPTDDILVIDTGLGFEKDGQLQIHSNLWQAGIDPAKVTKVLMSHLHKDHAGGIGPCTAFLFRMQNIMSSDASWNMRMKRAHPLI